MPGPVHPPSRSSAKGSCGPAAEHMLAALYGTGSSAAEISDKENTQAVGLCLDVLFTQTSSESFSKVLAEWESPARAYTSGRVPGCGVEDPADYRLISQLRFLRFG